MVSDRKGLTALATLSAVLLQSVVTTPSYGQGQVNWPFSGGDIRNSRSSADTKIGISNVGKLKVKWSFETLGDVSATPTVYDGTVFVVDFGGGIHAVDAATGATKWKSTVTNYTGNPGGSFSRTAPAVSGPNIIIGDQGDFDTKSPFNGFFPTSVFGDSTGKTASIMAINRATGALAWRTVIDPHPWSMVTSASTVYNGIVYVGVCSFEEAMGLLGPLAGAPSTFRGSVVAVNASTGAILWKTYMVPAGYSGGAVWGSSPAIDPARGTVYVATGNNYTIPAAVESLIAADPANGGSYLPADDYVDAVVALDLKTGAVKWANRVQGPDTWNIARGFIPPSLDPAQGPDYDFGSGPNIFSLGANGLTFVGAGQKSGIYWCMNPDTGAVAWRTQVGPGGTTGGIQWGSATDGIRVYCAVTNSAAKPHVIGGVTYTRGSWAALNAANGNILWQIPDPDENGRGYGMVTVSNGVMFAASTSGTMYAFDASTGKILWSFRSGGSTICGPSVVNGVVYWGSGYGRFFNTFGTPNNKLYAFDLPK